MRRGTAAGRGAETISAPFLYAVLTAPKHHLSGESPKFIMQYYIMSCREENISLTLLVPSAA